ncbi:MAG: SsrA-binding protein SmpB [Alphaproteobacteria bacterium]|nr:SsrA-binding protein SmpB [Alphaproteobacteria bacterium]
MARKKEENRKVVSENRKARFNYAIESTLEAGMQLTGTEVKSLREGKATIAESYAHVKDGEVFLVNATIPEYAGGNRLNHEPTRVRRLLLKAKEIDKLSKAADREGMTLVPLKIYFNDRGFAKIDLGVAKGKKLHDKRDTEKQRDWQRDKARLMRQKG